MKKLLITLSAIGALAISIPANANTPLDLDDFGCMPKTSFKQGQTYSVNATERWQMWQDELGVSEPFGSWQFVIEPARAKAVKFNGAFPQVGRTA